MPMDFKNTGLRNERRAKRRKTNIILNTLITIVIILIIIVGSYIFFGGDNKDKETLDENAKTTGKVEKPIERPTQTDKQTEAEQEKTIDEVEPEQKELIETESNEANVEKVIVDPAWKPIGTAQTGTHQYSASTGTTDWDEKLAAAAYAVGISVDQMTPWWVERGADRDNQSVLTVSEKVAGATTFRVYLDWVDGEGWKPTEVKQLKTNDKK